MITELIEKPKRRPSQALQLTDTLTTDTLSRFLQVHHFQPVGDIAFRHSRLFSQYSLELGELSIEVITGYNQGLFAHIMIRKSGKDSIVFPARRMIGHLEMDFTDAEKLCED